MVTFLTVLHIIVCLFLILVVLLQAGKGGGVGIAFGGGGSQTVFGSSGAGNFLTRLTSATAFIFLVTSLGLAHYASQQDSKRLQQLAERKGEEKKVEDARAAKLKEELDKARAAAKNTGVAPTPMSTEAPPAGAAPKAPENAAGKAPTAPDTAAKAKAPVKAVVPAEKAAAPADGTTEPAKPKKKRRAAPAAVPGAEGEAKPAAPPAEAPAAPPAQ